MLIFDPPYLVRRKSLGDGLKIDYIGFGLLALGLGALEVVLDEGQKEDWFSSNFIVTFAAITVLGLIARGLLGVAPKTAGDRFPRAQRPQLHRRHRHHVGAGVRALLPAPRLLPLFLQTLLGYTAMLSGLVLSPGGLVVVRLHAAGRLVAAASSRRAGW